MRAIPGFRWWGLLALGPPYGKIASAGLAACVLLSAASAIARQGDDPVDSRYKDAVAKMAKTLETLPSYRVDITLAWKASDGKEGSNAFVFLFDRGGKYRVEIRPDGKADPSLLAVNDGKTVTVLLPSKKRYTQGPALDPNDLLEDSPLLAESLRGTLIDSLTKKGMKDFILDRTRRASLVGTEDLDGRKVDHFHLLWNRDEEEYWIGPEGEVLPRKLIRISQLPGKDEGFVKLTSTTTLKWTIGKPFEASAFTLDLPKDAKKVDDLDAASVQPHSIRNASDGARLRVTALATAHRKRPETASNRFKISDGWASPDPVIESVTSIRDVSGAGSTETTVEP